MAGFSSPPFDDLLLGLTRAAERRKRECANHGNS
jgi:hypothetical protein